MKDSIVSQVEQIAARVGGSEGIEIVEVELKGSGPKRMLRITIDKPAGVTHGDCELISHEVGTILDVEGVIPGVGYTLEVTSPGVERKLLKLSDFERFQGKKAKVSFHEPVEGSRHWEGVLAGVEAGSVTLEVGPGRTLQFSLDQIERANLKFEWGKQSRRAE